MTETNQIKGVLTFKGYSVLQNGDTRVRLEFPENHLVQAIESLVFVGTGMQVLMSTGKQKYKARASFQKLVFKADGTAELWVKSHTDDQKMTQGFLQHAAGSTVKAKLTL